MTSTFVKTAVILAFSAALATAAASCGRKGDLDAPKTSAVERPVHIA